VYVIFYNFRIPLAPNSIESILSEAIKLEFEAYSSLAKSHQNSRELNDAERAKLNELIVANKALHEPLDDDLSTLVGDDTRFKVCSGLLKSAECMGIILCCDEASDYLIK
jgi:nuclear receptor subfamily 1 group I